MARRKETITQRDFALGQVRSDMLERDDLEVRQRSLKLARNMRPLVTGAIEARPGFRYVRAAAGAKQMYEIRPADNVVYALIIGNNYVWVLDENGGIVKQIGVVPWTDGAAVWVEAFRENIVIGGEHGINVLTYDDGAWTFDEWSFVARPGGETGQPYWAFHPGTSILPSDTTNPATGVITITASDNVFVPEHVGLRIRYNLREIEITEYVTRKFVRGTIITELPPSYVVTVSNAADFKQGESVVAADTNYQGDIVAISGNDLYITTTNFFDGPDVDENISGPTETSKITAVSLTTPLASVIWDEALMSPVRGYPRSAASASGRMAFLDFPQVPDLVVMSSARSIFDCHVGAADDDALARQIGDDSPRFLYAVNAGDLLLFSDRGCYLVPTRDTGVLTPSTFNAVKFDKRGAAQIKPVPVHDGVVFVEANNETVSAALLDGNIYLKWSVQAMTLFTEDVVKTPVSLCGPALWRFSEKYLFTINADGTMAVVAYNVGLQSETVGFAPWDTTGEFIHLAPLFGDYWALVDRWVDGVKYRMLERLDDTVFLDSAAVTVGLTEADTLAVNGDDFHANGDTLTVAKPAQLHLAGETVSIIDGTSYLGDFAVGATGAITDPPDVVGTCQIGFDFTAEIQPWPAMVINSTRASTFVTRTTRFFVNVQDTGAIQIACNNDTRSVGGYDFGDDLSADAPMRTKLYRVPVFGRKDHPDFSVSKAVPGRFRILTLGQEVQA